MKFTPGPWRVRESSVTQQLMVSQEGKFSNICSVFETSKGEVLPQKYNAKLISAAPDLLAACQRCLDGFQLLIASGDLTDDEKYQIGLLKRAIRKATE